MNNVPNLENLYLIIFAIFGMFFVAFLYLKRSKVIYNQTRSKLNVLETLSLGAKEKIFLLQAHRTKILVGVTGNNIRTLHVFDQAIFQEKLETQTDKYSNVNIATKENVS